MDVQDWLAMTNTESLIIRVDYYAVDKDGKVRGALLGHGKALIVDPDEHIAVMLTELHSELTHIYGGEVISYRIKHPEVPAYMVESVASIGPRDASNRPVPPCKI